MDQLQFDHVRGAVEALLFVSEKPVTIDQFKGAIQGVHASDLKEVLAALKKEYDGVSRGMVVVEIANGWQMLSSSNYAGYVREFYKTRHKEKLSRPSLEVLAIIAYKQPVSRADVEVIRGVSSDGVVMHLLNKGLIKIVGRKEVPGRPYVYGTTVQFLEYFGLRALEDLPKLEDFPAMMAQENEVQPTVNPDALPVPLAVAPTALAPEVSEVQEGSPAVVSETEMPLGTTSVSSAEFDQTTLEQVHKALEEEMAKARTRLDIDELERKVEVSPEFMDPDLIGEPSGQARRMLEEAATDGREENSPRADD